MKKLLNILIAPHEETPKEFQLRATILSASILFLLPIFITGSLTAPDGVRSSLQIGVILVVVAYALSRTKHYPLASGLTTLVLSFPNLIALPSYAEQGPELFLSSIAWVMLPILFSIIMLTTRMARWIVWGHVVWYIGYTAIFIPEKFAAYATLPLLWLLCLCMISLGLLKLRKGDIEHAEKMGEAKAAADSRNQQKSRFLANMSHELRTPLNAIIGYAEMLEEELEELESIDPVHLADLRKIHGAGGHLLHLINQVLDLEKIEAGKMELSIEECQSAAFIEEIKSLTTPLMEKNHNEFQLQIDALPETLTLDRLKAKQVLLNLLSNAAKFTEKGQCSLTISPLLDTPETLQFVVKDNGIGMSQDEQEIVFSPFVQATTQTANQFGGTGLGLAITNRLCLLMGGSLEMESAPGKGTTMTLLLPIAISR